jgi:hypothetical protein
MKKLMVGFLVSIFLFVSTWIYADHPIVFIPEDTFLSFSNQEVIPVPIYTVEPGKEAYNIFQPIAMASGKAKVLFKTARPAEIVALTDPIIMDQISIRLMDFIRGAGGGTELLMFAPHPTIAGIQFTEGPVFLYGGDNPTEFTQKISFSNNVQESTEPTPTVLEIQSRRYQEPLNYNSLSQYKSGLLKNRKVNRQLYLGLTSNGKTLQPDLSDAVHVEVLSLPTTGISTLVQLENEDIVLIDCGTEGDGERILERIHAIEYNARKSINEIQIHVVLTNMDSDQMGGFLTILQELAPRIGTIVVNTYTEPVEKEEADSEDNTDTEASSPTDVQGNETEVLEPSDAEPQILPSPADPIIEHIHSAGIPEQTEEGTNLTIRIFSNPGSRLNIEQHEKPDSIMLSKPDQLNFVTLLTHTPTQLVVSQINNNEIEHRSDNSLIVQIKSNELATLIPSSIQFSAIELLDLYQRELHVSQKDLLQQYATTFFLWTENLSLLYEVLQQSDEEKSPTETVAWVEEIVKEAGELGEQVLQMDELSSLSDLLYQIFLQQDYLTQLKSELWYTNHYSYQSEYYFWNHHVGLNRFLENVMESFLQVVQPKYLVFSVRKYSLSNIEYPAIYDYINRLNSKLIYNPYFQSITPLCTVGYESTVISVSYELTTYEAPPAPAREFAEDPLQAVFRELTEKDEALAQQERNEVTTTVKKILFGTYLDDVTFIY